MARRTKRNHSLHELVSEYEAMVDEGIVGYLAEGNFLELISYYESDFEIEKAIEVAEYARDQYSYCVDFYLIHARLLLLNGQPDLALQHLEKAEVISPNDFEVQLLKIRIHTAAGNTEIALNDLSVLKRFVTGSEKVELYLCGASIYESKKDFSKMFKFLSKALRLDPQNEEALDKIWMSVELSKKYDASIELHQKILDQDAFNYLAWFNLGHAYACLGEYQDAIDCLEYSYLINEDFEMGYLDCAELCCQVQDFRTALNIYQEAAEKFGSDEDHLVKLAECSIELKEYKEAKSYLIQALHIDQYNDEVYYNLGRCFREEGKHNNAISAFIKAIEIEDRREEYYLDLAESYVALNEFGKADFYFRKATEIGPEQELYWIRHAKFLVQRNKAHKACEILDEAEYHAVGTKLTFCRAACMIASNREKEGIKLLEEALSEDYSMSDVFFDILPEKKDDKNIVSMIRYYEGEMINALQ